MTTDPTEVRFPAALQNRAGWAEYLETRRGRFPHVHQIEPTNRCPFACTVCPRKQRMTRKQGVMDPRLFRKITNEIDTFPPDIRRRELELFHFGEALLHPQLAELVAHAVDLGLNVVLSVNPPLVTEPLAQALLRAAPARIVLSVDGHDSESYQRVRGPAADFAGAVEGVRRLVRAKEQTGSGTDLLARAIETNENSSYFNKIESFWLSEGVAFERRDFFPWTEPELANLGQYRRLPPGMPCPFCWQYLVVQWDGTVVPCCRDYDGQNVMGDAKERSLVEIWNGSRYAAFRREMAAGGPALNRFCARCSTIYSTPETGPSPTIF